MSGEEPVEEVSTAWDLEKFGDAALVAGTGAQVYLYRLEPREKHTKDAAYLGKYAKAPSLDEIREEHGGGRYMLRLLDKGKFAGAVATFSISGRPKMLDADDASGSPLDQRLARIEQLLAKKQSGGDDEFDLETREIMRTHRMERVASILAGKNGSKLGELKELFDLVDRRAAGIGDDDEEGPPELLEQLASLLVPILQGSGRSGARAAGSHPGMAVSPAPQPPPPAPPAIPPRVQVRMADRFEPLARALANPAADVQAVAVAVVSCFAPIELQFILTKNADFWISSLQAQGISIARDNPAPFLEEVRAAVVEMYGDAAQMSVLPEDREDLEGD